MGQIIKKTVDFLLESIVIQQSFFQTAFLLFFNDRFDIAQLHSTVNPHDYTVVLREFQSESAQQG